MISNELDIAFHVFVSKLLRVVYSIVTLSSERNRTSDARNQRAMIVFLIGFYVSKWSARNKKCMYCCDEMFILWLERYLGVYFPCCFATREINPQMTFSGVQK